MHAVAQGCAQDAVSVSEPELSMIAECTIDGLAMTRHGSPRGVLMLQIPQPPEPRLFVLNGPHGNIFEIESVLMLQSNAMVHLNMIVLPVQIAS